MVNNYMKERKQKSKNKLNLQNITDVKLFGRCYNVSSNATLNDIADMMKIAKKLLFIEQYHPYAITKLKNGRYQTYIKDKNKTNKRKQIVRKDRDDLIDFLYKHYKESVITLDYLFDEWIEYKSLHCAKSTVKRIKYSYKRYYEGTDIINIPLHELDTLQLDIWIHKLIKDIYPNKHQYGNCTVIIRQELDYAVMRGIIDFNPWDNVKVDTRRLLKPERKKANNREVFTKEEQELFFKAAWNDYKNDSYRINKLLPLAYMFVFKTGVRLGELCGLRYSDINHNILTVQRMVLESGEIVDKTKGCYGDRIVPLVPDAQKIIELCKERQNKEGIKTDYIFSMRSSPLNHNTTRTGFLRYNNKCDIRPAKSIHKARKTFISTLFDSGMSLNTVRQLAGHTDERTTLKNYCYDRSTDHEIIRQMITALS